MLTGSVPIPITLLQSELPDLAVRVYAVVASYSRNPAGCFATAEYIGDVLSVERESAQRMLSALTRRGFIIEETRRGKLVGRRARELGPREHMVMVARRAIREVLSSREFRLLAYLTYCGNVGRYVTDADQTRVLRKGDGTCVSVDTVQRARASLRKAGWITVGERTARGTAYRGTGTPRPEPVAAMQALASIITTPDPAPEVVDEAVDERPEHVANPQPDHTSPRNSVTSPPRNQITPDRATLDHVNVDQVRDYPAVGDLRQRRGLVPEARPSGTGQQDRRDIRSGVRMSSLQAKHLDRMWKWLESLMRICRDDIALHAQARIAKRFLFQLEHRTPEELRQRIKRRWLAIYSLQEIDGPVGVIMALIAGTDCSDVRCEDGTLLLPDGGSKRCPRCDERGGDFLRSRGDGHDPSPVTRPGRAEPRRDVELRAPSPPPARQRLAEMFPAPTCPDTFARGLAAVRAALPSGSTRLGVHARRSHRGDDQAQARARTAG
ncbi:hypothetical protein ACIBG8_54575 [Nonomuraea sp. NPDC050556]|uniref:hypothetical protein n=1 Tax=Nonomuraea sp. NPDC050556 TaxID=3364369 RepID=UPI0037AF17DF